MLVTPEYARLSPPTTTSELLSETESASADPVTARESPPPAPLNVSPALGSGLPLLRSRLNASLPPAPLNVSVSSALLGAVNAGEPVAVALVKICSWVPPASSLTVNALPEKDVGKLA